MIVYLRIAFQLSDAQACEATIHLCWQTQIPLSMEMEEIPTRAVSRQLTLESQRQTQPSPSILKRLQKEIQATYSPLPGPVTDAIEQMAGRYSPNARKGRRFLNNFGHMSRRPEPSLHKVFDLFIRLPHTAAESIERAADSGEAAARSSTVISTL